MSTDLRIVNKDVYIGEIFDGRLEKYGIVEEQCHDTSPDRRLLTDGRNWLWVSSTVDGCDMPGVFFKTSGLNNPQRIVDAIEKSFDAQIFTEHEPQYWGLDTQEEWDAAEEAMANDDREKFYVEVMKYVNGQQNGINPGTNGEVQAKIAKELIARRPELGLPNAKDELMGAIDAIFERDHVVKVHLDESTIALAKLAFTNDEGLSQC